MTDKLQSASNPQFALSDIAVFTLSGRDCIAFAQAQFMSDVAALGDGQWQWSGWLTPKGRVVALFAVVRHSAERLDLVVLDGDVDALAASLKRYVFRSKVAIETRGELQVSGGFFLPAQARGAQATLDGDGFELDVGSPAQPRTLCVRAIDPVLTHDADAHRAWRAFDLAHGLPRLPDDQREQWTPQQLSLERLRAFSVAKGCYPGQEIVARTHFLGQAKRGLAALRGAPQAAPGNEIVAGDQAIGRVVCTTGDLLLAVLPIDGVADTLSVDGVQVTPTPLMDGLAR